MKKEFIGFTQPQQAVGISFRLKVINPNDLIARKAGRADVFAREYGLNIDESISAEEAVERANILKRSMDFSNTDPKEFPKKVAYIRMLADIADMKSLAKNTSIDMKYIQEAIKDYPTHDKKSLERLLLKTLGI